MMDFFKNIFLKPKNDDEESLSETGGLGIKFKVVVVEFAENVESSAGEVLTALLRTQDYLDVQYFNEPFAKSFLNLEGRTFFDFIDKGLAILDKTNADVVVWGYREDNKIRLNFQTSSQYEKNNTSLVSLLDSLYLPVSLFDNVATFPNSVLNLILGAIISSLNAVNKQVLIQQKYILRKIIKTLSADDSAKNMTLEFLPYIMNFLAIIYLTFCRRSDNEKEFRNTYRYEIRQLENWMKMKFSHVIFNSEQHDWSTISSHFDLLVFGKNYVVFLIEDSDGNVFGAFTKRIINTYYWIVNKQQFGYMNEDFHAHMFLLRDHGKFEPILSTHKQQQQPIQYAISLFPNESDELFRFGRKDLIIKKKEYKRECSSESDIYLIQHPLFNQKRNFHMKKVFVLQMKFEEEFKSQQTNIKYKFFPNNCQFENHLL